MNVFLEKIKGKLSFVVLFMMVCLSGSLSAEEWISPVNYRTAKLEAGNAHIHIYKDGLIIATMYTGSAKGSQLMFINNECIAQKIKPEQQLDLEGGMYDLYLYDHCCVLHSGSYQEILMY